MKTTTKTTQVNKRENVARFLLKAMATVRTEITATDIIEMLESSIPKSDYKTICYEAHTAYKFTDSCLNAFNKCTFTNNCKLIEVHYLQRTYIVFTDEGTGERFWFTPVLPRGHKEIKAIKETLMFLQCEYALTYTGYKKFRTHFGDWEKDKPNEIPNGSIWAYYQGMNVDNWGKSVFNLFTFDLMSTQTKAKVNYEDVILLSATVRRAPSKAVAVKAVKAKKATVKKASKKLPTIADHKKASKEVGKFFLHTRKHN